MIQTAGSREVPCLAGYELLDKLGEGGMGAVYKARKLDTGQLVAVKLLPPDKGSTAIRIKRFEQEFRAALRLDHPHIVKVLDFGSDRGFHYLAMELVEGQSLGRLIQERGALPESSAIEIVLQIATALQQVHKLKLVHRDVKPDNILLAAGGLAKLTDLGLVKVLDDDVDLTRPNQGLGTPNFMAPEQFSNAKRADPRCDIYSLGETLYMTVTGLVPFQASTPLAVLKKKHRNELAPVRNLVPALSERLEQTITRAMSPEPMRRHRSCEEFIADLTGQSTPRSRRSSATIRILSRPPRQYSGTERRASLRHVSNQGARCLPLAGHKEDEWKACIRDISVTGLGLLVNRRFESGTVLQVQLEDAGAEAPRRLFVRVVHHQALAPRKWLLGCTFPVPLSEEELQALL